MAELSEGWAWMCDSPDTLSLLQAASLTPHSTSEKWTGGGSLTSLLLSIDVLESNSRRKFAKGEGVKLRR